MACASLHYWAHRRRSDKSIDYPLSCNFPRPIPLDAARENTHTAIRQGRIDVLHAGHNLFMRFHSFALAFIHRSSRLQLIIFIHLPQPPCKRLWCTTSGGEQEGCRTQHMPWADGTPCGRGRWCRHGACVSKDTRSLEPVDGNWGPWQEWVMGSCSRQVSSVIS